ncbi:MAG: surface-adhesin E family protein [Leptolyngbya sp. BL-A-14]
MSKLVHFSIVAIVAIVTPHLQASAAPAKAKWVYVGSNANFRFYIDTHSLKKSGDFVWFWTRANRIEFPEPDSNLRIYSTFTYSSTNCRRGVIQFRNTRSYDRNQKLLPEFSIDFNGATASVDQNHPVTRYICRKSS